MSALTQQERDALEDVFLSIHTKSNKYTKIKELSSFIMTADISIALSKLLKRAKFGLRKRKTAQFFSFFDKKKKFLSK
ncbi:MAG: hypothetical protein PHO62_03890 [Sulfurimonas sp.]|uniref:hypothetical protein n=1 Tax=Sulfurimonas sp. TaxID=2022749 RepID=UPI00263960C0|nr:hypothetical protein [Sulfurimonas sp.]MDD5372553.1 hypothetical protein [Sulfurimonas sp.]